MRGVCDMRKWKNMLSAAISAAVLAGMMSMTAYADTKVTSISLEVESDIQVGEEYSIDDVTITTKSDKYLVGDMEFLNDGYEWEPTDTPRLQVDIEANDGYYLMLSAKNIKIKGATYERGVKINSTTVRLTLALPSLSETVGDITEVRWSDGAVASWNAAYNAGNYQVKLYRDGKAVNTTQTTAVPYLDLSPLMTKEGNYYFKVRAVNVVKSENTSEWVESGEMYLPKEKADANKALYGSAANSGYTEPGQALTPQTGWNKDAIGWWYLNEDGTYPASNWKYIHDKWYFFDSKGYMQTGWILWNHQYYYCDTTNGDMLYNCMTPDGYRLDSAGVWIQ